MLHSAGAGPAHGVLAEAGPTTDPDNNRPIVANVPPLRGPSAGKRAEVLHPARTGPAECAEAAAAIAEASYHRAVGAGGVGARDVAARQCSQMLHSARAGPAEGAVEAAGALAIAVPHHDQAV